MSAENPQISVFILTRNRPKILRKCVESVLQQSGVSFELLILDDASDCGDTGEMMRNEYNDDRIRTWRSATSRGVAGGRNFLMEQARGEYLVSIDDDAVFETENELSRVPATFSEDPTTSIICFRIINHIQGEQKPLLPFSQVHVKNHPDCDKNRNYVSTYIGCGHAIRRSLIEQVGSYHPTLVFGTEEIDLSYRCIEAGHRISYEPGIVVHHHPQQSVVAGSHRHHAELYYGIRNRIYVAYRYLPLKYLTVYIFVWLSRSILYGIRMNSLPDVARGCIAAVGFTRSVRRCPLDATAIAYLRRHDGRLWY